jgi:hypothetical protein
LPNNEWGDFQTPIGLAAAVMRTLPERSWSRVLEPTCGEGTFLTAATQFGAERIGVELQEKYALRARATGAQIIQGSIFDLDLGSDLVWRSDGPLLVVGNPPWVTSADLGSYGSINMPKKTNFRNLRGIEAITGASNFDIAEFIWLKLIVELSADEPVVALLCKTQVARNVLTHCFRHRLPINGAVIRRIDAKRWFGASVDACLFTLAVGGEPDWSCVVYPDLEAAEPEVIVGFANGRLVADLDAWKAAAFADGSCQLEWRQGVKHDAASIMELAVDSDGKLVNKMGEIVDVEESHVFPLLKATDLHRDRLVTERRVIVTQRGLSDDTSKLIEVAPKLWAYLNEHSDVLDARKSSIYRARARFAMFGVGDYTFASWKVAVSGLHKAPEFRVVGPNTQKPVIFDDTCYFLPLESRIEALLIEAALRSPPARALFRSLIFGDAKRPITKSVLQRVDLAALIRHTDTTRLLNDAAARADRGGTNPNEGDLERLLARLEDGRIALNGI